MAHEAILSAMLVAARDHGKLLWIYEVSSSVRRAEGDVLLSPVRSAFWKPRAMPNDDIR